MAPGGHYELGFRFHTFEILIFTIFFTAFIETTVQLLNIIIIVMMPLLMYDLFVVK